MRRNASGQIISCHLVSRTSGEDIPTGTVNVFITIDGGAQFLGAGTIEHEGNGDWTYHPLQTETNGNYLSFTFVHPQAINQTIGVYTASPAPRPPSSPNKLLARSGEWLGQLRRKYLAQTVTYIRDVAPDAISLELMATVGQTMFQLDDGAGAVIVTQSRDYLIDAAELAIADQRIIPIKGDRLIESVNGATLTYEVMGPGDEPVWRWADVYHRTLRIHTKASE
jgi:hypothetical protein